MEVEQGYKDADTVLNSASDLLAREIGFIDFEWNNEKVSIRDSLSVLAERRIDSEYWQIGFDEILEKLVRYKNGFSKLEDKFKQAKKTFKASDLTDYQYIEISDIDVRSGEISPNSVHSQELPANAKIELLNRSLLVSKVRPNRGAIAIAEGLDGAVVSGALVTLTPIADMNLETLMTYLRLEPIREFILKFNTGTSYPTITDEVVMQLPVPNIPSDLQSQLSELINRSKLLHRTAKNSLKNLVDSI
jgi:type I restriction enzyme S subunit